MHTMKYNYAPAAVALSLIFLGGSGSAAQLVYGQTSHGWSTAIGNGQLDAYHVPLFDPSLGRLETSTFTLAGDVWFDAQWDTRVPGTDAGAILAYGSYGGSMAFSWENERDDGLVYFPLITVNPDLTYVGAVIHRNEVGSIHEHGSYSYSLQLGSGDVQPIGPGYFDQVSLLKDFKFFFECDADYCGTPATGNAYEYGARSTERWSLTYEYLPSVPEPSIWMLLLAGFGGCGLAIRFAQKHRAADPSASFS